MLVAPISILSLITAEGVSLGFEFDVTRLSLCMARGALECLFAFSWIRSAGEEVALFFLVSSLF